MSVLEIKGLTHRYEDRFIFEKADLAVRRRKALVFRRQMLTFDVLNVTHTAADELDDTVPVCLLLQGVSTLPVVREEARDRPVLADNVYASGLG